MGIKETVAFVGSADQPEIDLINKFCQQNYPLLIVADDSKQGIQIKEQIAQHITSSENIEVIECAKEGCWEADIIVLANSGHIDKTILEKIADVATQKIVILTSFSGDDGSSRNPIKNIQSVLPNSKVVQVRFNTFGAEVFVSSLSTEAAFTTVSILETLGYQAQVE